MSETLTPHQQWIRHAVAAAKAGNPAVAKIQLQKAAEEAPGDPAVWLWMGWLADSPASAAQCLELARSDQRFEKMAVAGIEFTRALANFQLEDLLEDRWETVAETDDEIAPEAVAVDLSVLDPVEAVEDVAAVVDSLQQEDAAEPAVADATPEPAESTDDVSVDLLQETDPSDADTATETENEGDLSALDDVRLEIDVPDRDVSAPAEVGESQQSEVAPAIDVEAELLQSANELWQITDESAVEMTDEAGTASVEKSPQDILDESEDDFVFATEEDVAFEPVEPAYAESPPLNNRRNPTPHVGDQWLAQVAVEEPHTPVWRKAQSDWFSVDGVSDPEPEPARRANNPAVQPPDSPAFQHPITAPSVTQHSNDVVEGEPASAEITEPTQTITTQTITEGSPVDSPPSEVTSQAAAPRIKPSDVWQTAAIEKSALSAASVAQAPLYTAAIVPSSVEPTSTEDNPVKPSLADAALHSLGSVSDSGTSPFLVADRPGAPFPTNSSATARPFGQKTVLVVDDSPTVRKLVSITLEKRGYKVVSAFDGVAAIKEIAGHNPSLILMDVNMPRLDGYQLCKLVKKHETTRNIPVLMLTGKDGMFDRLRGRLVGCAGSIAKPFTPEALIEAVEQQLVQVT